MLLSGKLNARRRLAAGFTLTAGGCSGGVTVVAASFVVSGEPVFSDGWLFDALSPVAGSVPRLFSRADASEIQVTAVGIGDLGAEVALLVKVVGELVRIPHEERLAFLAERGYSARDVQRTSAFVESWMQNGVRRELRRFGAVADELGTGFRPAFREWFEGAPVDALVLGVLDAKIPQPSLALAYAVCELCEDLRAARNFSLVRQHVPDWESVPGLSEDVQGYRLDEASFVVDAES